MGAGDQGGAPAMTFAEVERLVRPISGTFSPSRLTLFSIFRDEMFFCRAFFDHYRRLGVEQFLIVDDGSVDGTRAFLRSQPDCVTLTSTCLYGDAMLFRDPGGRLHDSRAGIYLKGAVPHVLLPGRFVLYVDADEFLIPPPGVSKVGEVIERLDCMGARSCAASLVELAPHNVADLALARDFASLDDLVAAYPYFEPEALVEVDGLSRARFLAPSKSTRLFEEYGIRERARGVAGLFGRQKPPRRTPRHKTPLLLRAKDSFMVGSHDGNTPPSAEVLLCLLHFVFTCQFAAKVERARAWRSHFGNSEKYRLYARLLERMRERGGVFTTPRSERFRSADQLVGCGLMKW
jgi:hypothetical protein